MAGEAVKPRGLPGAEKYEGARQGGSGAVLGQAKAYDAGADVAMEEANGEKKKKKKKVREHACGCVWRWIRAIGAACRSLGLALLPLALPRQHGRPLARAAALTLASLARCCRRTRRRRQRQRSRRRRQQQQQMASRRRRRR